MSPRVDAATEGRCEGDTFSTTVRFLERPHDRYHRRARVLDVPDMIRWGKYKLSDELRLLWVVLRAAAHDNVLLLYSSRGSWKPELCAAVLIGFWPRRWRPRVVFYGEMYQPNTGIRRAVERCAMKLADRSIYRYVLSSKEELQVFAETWGVDPDKLRCCPVYFETRPDDRGTPSSRGTHLFAGGDSLRDYRPLIEAARRLPEHQFVFCTTRLDGYADLPRNVRIGPTERELYLEWMATAAAVLIPIRLGLRRTSGLFTLLHSMHAKKPTVVPSVLGVRDAASARSVRIVDGSPEGYIEAIRWILAPENAAAVDDMCEEAHRIVSTQFTRDRHIECLLRTVDEACRAVESAA